jgi:hypothetical protein
VITYVAFIFVLKYTDQFGNNFDKNPGIRKKRIQDRVRRRYKDKSHVYTENGHEDNGSGPGLLAGFGS